MKFITLLKYHSWASGIQKWINTSHKKLKNIISIVNLKISWINKPLKMQSKDCLCKFKNFSHLQYHPLFGVNKYLKSKYIFTIIFAFAYDSVILKMHLHHKLWKFIIVFNNYNDGLSLYNWHSSKTISVALMRNLTFFYHQWLAYNVRKACVQIHE